jgi:hypothetical protein
MLVYLVYSLLSAECIISVLFSVTFLCYVVCILLGFFNFLFWVCLFRCWFQGFGSGDMPSEFDIDDVSSQYYQAKYFWRCFTTNKELSYCF